MAEQQGGDASGRKIPRVLIRDVLAREADSAGFGLAGLMSALALNPVEFINASEARQLRMLSEVFQVDVSIDELQELSGGLLDVGLLRERSDLRGLDLLQAALRQINGSLRDASTLQARAIEQAGALRAVIPDGFRPDDIRGVSSADLAAEVARIHQHNHLVLEATARLGNVERESDQLVSEISQVGNQIRELQARLESLGTRQNAAEAQKEELQAWLASNPLAEAASLQVQLSRLDDQRACLARFDRATDLEEEARALAGVHRDLSDAKGLLTVHFPSILAARAKIPVEGLSIHDETLRVNGLPIGSLSDEEKLRLAVQIAAAGAPGFGAVCIDGAERMHGHDREMLLTFLQSAGLQFFVTEVSSDDLPIRQLGSLGSPEKSDPTAELRALFTDAQLASPLIVPAALSVPPPIAHEDSIALAPGFDEPAGFVEEPAAANTLVATPLDGAAASDATPDFDEVDDLPLGFDGVPPGFNEVPPGFDDVELDAAPGFDEEDGIPLGFDGGYGDDLPPPPAASGSRSESSADAFNFGF